MGEAFLDRAVGRLARTQAVEPVGHVLGGAVVDSHRRRLGFAGKEEVLRLALPVDVGVALVGALLLDYLVAGAALAADVDQSGLLPHVAGETRGVVAEARRVA